MHITLINQFYKPDLAPTGRLAASLAEHRAAMGDHVTVITSRGGYVPESWGSIVGDERNPQVIRLWTPELGKGAAWKRLVDYAAFFVQAGWRALRLARQDLLISLTTPPFIYLTALLHKLAHPRARVMLWIMDCYPEALERMGGLRPGSAIGAVLRGINRRAFRFIDRIICLDRAMEALILSQYSGGSARLVTEVIPNWEPVEEFPDESAPPRWEVIDPMDLDGKFVVLYLGNAGLGHPFETVIEAAEHLRDDEVVFLFVGGGEKWDTIKQVQEERDLSNLIMHRYVPKEMTPSVMASADCGLITLSDDALGVISPSKLHGYLAMGLPVIYVGPEGGNVDQSIKRHNCGISLRHQNSKDMVHFIRSMREDEARRNTLSLNARVAYASEFSDQVAHLRFDHVIREVVGA